MSTKKELVNELSKNEHVIQIISADILKQTWDRSRGIVKKAIEYTSTTMDLNTARKLMQDLGYNGKVAVEKYGKLKKLHVIFKGNQKVRSIFRGTNYLASNPKVVRMAIGSKGIAKSVKGGSIITVVLITAFNVFDFFIRDKVTLHQMLGILTTDLAKIGISSIAGAVAGMVAGSVVIIASSAVAPLLIVIGVGVITGILLNKIDEKYGVTQKLIEAYENIGVEFQNTKSKIDYKLYKLERSIEQYYMGKFFRTWMRGY